MGDAGQPSEPRENTVRFEPETPCDECGRFGAYRFADRALCDECYAGRGSCCPEFGKDDLWSRDDDS
ncbi:MAG: hypothetical protein ACREIA_26785 [Opitutaceae bacterium]